MIRKLFLLLITLSLFIISGLAHAGENSDSEAQPFDWKTSKIPEVAQAFILKVGQGDFQGAYSSGGEVLRKERSLEQFQNDMTKARLDQVASVQCTGEVASAVSALPAAMGYRINCETKLKDGSTMPVYVHLEGDAHVAVTERNNQWSDATKWTVMDYHSAESMFTRQEEGRATTLDNALLIGALALGIAFLGLIGYYIKGLMGAPRELYLMYYTQVTEYAAYGSASVIMVMFLQQEVMLNGEPMGDTTGYLYYTVWTLSSTVITIMVGSVCDTIGIKKTLLIGSVALIISRFFMPITSNVYLQTLLGFVPLAIGFAITGPVLKVAIKKFTTMEQATLGFGLFYTLMNVGFAIGAELTDYFRAEYAQGAEVMGMHFSTFQLIIFVGFLINIPDFIAILLMRDGAEMTENGLVIPKEKKKDEGLVGRLQSTIGERQAVMLKEFRGSLLVTAIISGVAFLMYQFGVHAWKLSTIPVGKYLWAFVATIAFFAIAGIVYAVLSYLGTMNISFDVVMKSVRDATEKTITQLKENFQDRPFWVYMGMLGILVFVKLTFYIFNLMFPLYATRVFGEDFPVASIFGTLNPVMIIFLVPLISAATTKVRSFTMLLLGTGLSAASVFLCFSPDSLSIMLADSWFGEWVFDYWLEAPIGNRDPFMMSLIIFIMVFTVGEAIWSPRLMQFSAEIAPRGKEGAYIALSMLPYFLGKAGAGIMAEQMTELYFKADQVTFPNQEMTWAWIGGMAAISPIGLVIFKGVFTKREQEALEEAEAFAAQAKAEKEAAQSES